MGIVRDCLSWQTLYAGISSSLLLAKICAKTVREKPGKGSNQHLQEVIPKTSVMTLVLRFLQTLVSVHDKLGQIEGLSGYIISFRLQSWTRKKLVCNEVIL